MIFKYTHLIVAFNLLVMECFQGKEERMASEILRKGEMSMNSDECCEMKVFCVRWWWLRTSPRRPSPSTASCS